MIENKISDIEKIYGVIVTDRVIEVYKRNIETTKNEFPNNMCFVIESYSDIDGMNNNDIFALLKLSGYDYICIAYRNVDLEAVRYIPANIPIPDMLYTNSNNDDINNNIYTTFGCGIYCYPVNVEKRHTNRWLGRRAIVLRGYNVSYLKCLVSLPEEITEGEILVYDGCMEVIDTFLNSYCPVRVLGGEYDWN